MIYKSLALQGNDDKFDKYLEYFSASRISLLYHGSNCTQYKNTATLFEFDPTQETIPADYSERSGTSSIHYSLKYGIGNCTIGQSVSCKAKDNEQTKCRISVRMSALLTLAVCLIIKATYMVAVNVSMRRSVKSQCLTFGDVIVASAIDRDTRIHNECMVNAGDGYRHKTVHTCHKHCKDRVLSATGDSIGHCQRCKRYNIVDKAADLTHPSVAIKYKKSLISSLGTTALIQMTILMFCSMAMLAVSVVLAVGVGGAAADFKLMCSKGYLSTAYPCSISEAQYIKDKFGTWGGFDSSANVKGMNRLTNEALPFLIANAAQFLYSALYLLLTYNVTLISMESDWGNLERTRRRLRCTLVKGSGFSQSYLLQLPKKVLYPMMAFSAVMHWLLGQAISARETVFSHQGDASQQIEKSFYSVGCFRTRQEHANLGRLSMALTVFGSQLF